MREVNWETNRITFKIEEEEKNTTIEFSTSRLDVIVDNFTMFLMAMGFAEETIKQAFENLAD